MFEVVLIGRCSQCLQAVWGLPEERGKSDIMCSDCAAMEDDEEKARTVNRGRANKTNPETTLEEFTRVREELQGMRVALIALAKADDAYQAARKHMMRSPLHEALEVSSNVTHLERQREEAITLCVELGRSLP